MSAIVLLSSSPPRVFARSPTPVESSSPLPSPNTILKGGRHGPPRFKATAKTRDGFSSGFSSARSLLATKVGAENIPLRSPGREMFKPASSVAARDHGGIGSSSTNSATEKVDLHPDPESAQFKPSRSRPQTSIRIPETLACADVFDLPDATPRKESPTQDGRRPNDSSPLHLEQALPRRLDWTPVKPSVKTSVTTSEPEEPTLGFSRDLLDNFTYAEPMRREVHYVATKGDANGEPTKRRRIDLVAPGNPHAEPPLPPADSYQSKEVVRKGIKKRPKPPTKKLLTITGLATSHYGQEYRTSDNKVAPMLEYLTATQLGAADEPDTTGENLAKKSTKPKISRKRTGATKKTLAKSQLLSPTSAMKAIEGQETLFGSASQLAREESPTLLRDTLEALKRSECVLSSDPISPQRTQSGSIESTSPHNCRGTTRFVKKRNLWSAAGRDEDNALLHVDTVDLIDSPAVRLALTGKDVLLQPAQPGLQRSETGHRGPIGQNTDTPLANKTSLLIDIDDIVTPGLQGSVRHSKNTQTRSYHTTRVLGEPKGEKRTAEPNLPELGPTEVAGPATHKAVPVKPCYAGFSIHELQKQISAYGFKPVKKREKMIELLERCWEDRHGAPQSGGDKEEAPQATTHGDILSKVHDVSARPVPKVKKPRAKRKSEATEPKPAKEPKQRKKAEPKGKNPASKDIKKPRKSTGKKVSSDEAIMDVDDIDVEAGTSTRDGQALVSEKPLSRKTGTPKAKLASAARATKPATPPPTMPPISFSSPPTNKNCSMEAVTGEGSRLEDPSRLAELKSVEHTLTPDQTPPIPDIQTQIHAAIHFRPDPKATGADSRKRDHTMFPTWREKILMYDPICLEDLTVWLNTEGFRAIGEDREVGPLEVREWCEANGVCCLWKGGWRGNGQARGSGSGKKNSSAVGD
ncbi:hypothetical protein A1O3_04317 [Capronia epimyces CBS 606.96]|uniref:Structure-specific endonuclease subunit SLX4 n=1 Tax=Capronia epimyces CBS 606.96 TaxID=1182542 RepID=W9Y4F1_9EURO|nr:uncharacterized protein A1O3_04317 [Capronia epimyces CBS 606.96]EXJ87358.1 hypothetical protein A1O3_04317 [Capronia epimyces CBS 606.96]